MLAVRFFHAELKNGETIPIQATVEGMAPATSPYTWDADFMDMPAPATWNGKTLNLDIQGAAFRIQHA